MIINRHKIICSGLILNKEEWNFTWSDIDFDFVLLNSLHRQTDIIRVTVDFEHKLNAILNRKYNVDFKYNNFIL